MHPHFLILLLALVLDRMVGDPQWLWQRLPHPTVLFGKAIEHLERRFNRPGSSPYLKRRDGFAVMLALLIASGLAGLILHWLFRRLDIAGLVAEAVIVSVFLAQKSLADHVSAVARALKSGGLLEGRQAVSMIVGRDPEQLDEAGVCRAAIESLAENASDGVVAPALWYLAAGLPGLLAYKMLNTADSMIGHMSDRYRDFGRAAAKLDDAANWIPARLTGALIASAALACLGVSRGRTAFSAMMRDSRLHRSPNAGWPEAAMAGALGLALGGLRKYGADFVNEPGLHGAGVRCAGAGDVNAALSIFWAAMTQLTMLTGFFAIL